MTPDPDALLNGYPMVGVDHGAGPDYTTLTFGGLARYVRSVRVAQVALLPDGSSVLTRLAVGPDGKPVEARRLTKQETQAMLAIWTEVVRHG